MNKAGLPRCSLCSLLAMTCGGGRDRRRVVRSADDVCDTVDI
jgi:hypothetical protein